MGLIYCKIYFNYKNIVSKIFNESFKLAYAMSLAGQLGFYISAAFIIAIIGHDYMDKYFFDKYLIPDHQTVYLALDFTLAFAVGVYSIWQIYKIILPFMDDK